jgi:hypothetical protein
MSHPPGRMTPKIPCPPRPLLADELQAVRDYQAVLRLVQAGKASARREGEALAVLREVLCPGIIEPLPAAPTGG